MTMAISDRVCLTFRVILGLFCVVFPSHAFRFVVTPRAGTTVPPTRGGVAPRFVLSALASNATTAEAPWTASDADTSSAESILASRKTTHHLTLEQARLGLQLLRQAGCQKINFAGGEPFVQAQLLGQLSQISCELGLAVSIISNGSLITEKWMRDYGRYVDVLGVSADSFVPSTNAAIGRGGDANNQHAARILQVRDWCTQHSIKFKLNTVVCSLNWKEEMSEHVISLQPDRWKVFQVILEHENAGGPGDLRDARNLQVSKHQFLSFVDRHRHHPELAHVLIPEPNDVMQNSYLLLDEDMRFSGCSSGAKILGESILKVGVAQALQQSGFDHSMFVQRGGIYDWTRERPN